MSGVAGAEEGADGPSHSSAGSTSLDIIHDGEVIQRLLKGKNRQLQM
jgi:hypothetical protein